MFCFILFYFTNFQNLSEGTCPIPRPVFASSMIHARKRKRKRNRPPQFKCSSLETKKKVKRKRFYIHYYCSARRVWNSYSPKEDVRLFVCSFVRLFVCSFVRLFVCRLTSKEMKKKNSLFTFILEF